jgi:hypothetical protein
LDHSADEHATHFRITGLVVGRGITHQHFQDSSSQNTPARKRLARNYSQPETAKQRGNHSMPELAQLELIGANVYVDKLTGTLWFQVLPPKQSTD